MKRKRRLLDTGPKFLPDEQAFRAAADAAKSRVLAVYYSTVRAHPSPSKGKQSTEQQNGGPLHTSMRSPDVN